MKTIIYDIDGTLTDMSAIEEAVRTEIKDQEYTTRVNYAAVYDEAFSRLLEQKRVPAVSPSAEVKKILKWGRKYSYVYATGGYSAETEYVLREFGIIQLFDLENSISKTNCRFLKKSGIPFKKILRIYQNCSLVTDSDNDCLGAEKAGIPYRKVSL